MTEADKHAGPRADIGTAGVENDRLRHIRLHERVNELPDPNYATLKYFMGHLHRCVAESVLGCVWLWTE